MGQSDRIHYHYGAVLPLRGKNASDQQYSGAWNHPAYHGGAVNLWTVYWYRRKDSVFMEIVKAVDSGGSLLGGNVFLLSLPALLCFGKTLVFAGRGLISAVISFGGGDAYLAVANGMFVNTGMIGYDDFYFKIASVANGLPGSILCKILAGVGYILGCQSGGVWCGIFVALCGFACSIAASGGTFSAVVYIYERFENLQIFQVLQTYMRPIVADCF